MQFNPSPLSPKPTAPASSSGTPGVDKVASLRGSSNSIFRRGRRGRTLPNFPQKGSLQV